MRVLSGAITVLAGAIMFAATIVNDGLCSAAGRFSQSGGQGIGFVAGVVVALVGFGIMALGRREGG